MYVTSAFGQTKAPSLKKGYEAPKSIEDYYKHQPTQSIRQTLLFVIDSQKILYGDELIKMKWDNITVTKVIIDSSGLNTKRLVFISTKK